MPGKSADKPILSICLTCRDGREEGHEDVRGGTRLAAAVMRRIERTKSSGFELRGVRCMSQCKRSCIASICANGRFTYVFGDLDPETPDHLDALIMLSRRYLKAPEGFLSRAERPEPLRASILGRLPPPETESPLVTRLEPVTLT